MKVIPRLMEKRNVLSRNTGECKGHNSPSRREEGTNNSCKQPYSKKRARAERLLRGGNIWDEEGKEGG